MNKVLILEGNERLRAEYPRILEGLGEIMLARTPSQASQLFQQNRSGFTFIVVDAERRTWRTGWQIWRVWANRKFLREMRATPTRIFATYNDDPRLDSGLIQPNSELMRFSGAWRGKSGMAHDLRRLLEIVSSREPASVSG